MKIIIPKPLLSISSKILGKFSSSIFGFVKSSLELERGISKVNVTKKLSEK